MQTVFQVFHKYKAKVSTAVSSLKELIGRNPLVLNISITIVSLSVILIVFASVITHTKNIQDALLVFKSSEKREPSSEKVDAHKYIEQLKKENSTLERRLNSLLPTSGYMVVNTTENNFKLYRSRKLSLEGYCSTGSYVLLEADSAQKWIFKTPKGVFRILGKTESPVWKKPDWAFIEEGLPVPHPHASERFEYGVLGDYALSLGDGYLIHGTLYKRQLGMPVTHGCIRLGDEELEAVYFTLQHGSKVYIF